MERGHLEDVGVDGKIILKRISKTWNVVMDWIHLAHSKYKWQALVRTVMNLRVP